MNYTVIIVTGDYYPRQEAARAAGALLYIEVHGNADEDPTADGACCVLPLDPTPASLALGLQLAHVAAERAPHRLLREGGLRLGGKGWANVDPDRTGCPSALWEPGFVSCLAYDDWCRARGLHLLGMGLAATVRGALPRGGVVALSIGHEGRTSHPDDRGAPRVGGGWESEHNAEIVRVAAGALGRMTAPGVGR